MGFLKGVWYAAVSTFIAALMYFAGFVFSVIATAFSVAVSVGLTILVVFCIIKASVDESGDSLK
jgi:hypothetical protein